MSITNINNPQISTKNTK